MTREKQFELSAAARDRVLSWAAAEQIPLSHIDFVYPFVATDFGLSVWLFYATDVDRQSSERDGTTARVQREFLATLAGSGYDERWLGEVHFVADSHENAVRNYQGSYFYRLR
jgi:hypothetical protein